MPETQCHLIADNPGQTRRKVGAPAGNQNALKHGRYTAKAKAAARQGEAKLTASLDDLRATLVPIEELVLR